MKAIQCFDELVGRLAESHQHRRVAVVCARDESTRQAVARAEEAGFCEPIFVDDDDVDVAAAKAVSLVREGKADVLMKGLLNTDNLVKAILNKENGILPKGNVLTHITCAKMPQYDKLLFLTDVPSSPTLPLNSVSNSCVTSWHYAGRWASKNRGWHSSTARKR